MTEAAIDAVAEEVLVFNCGPRQLLGILASPTGLSSSVGVVIAVGGPQYRVGSHRQFVSLARRLAAAGHPTLRFDCRGMGDSEGAMQAFEQSGPDLQAAIDALCAARAQLRSVVVWGLCDAASAALMFATSHPRVAGIVAANPWARSAASLAATQVRHYYAARLKQAQFWSKLLRGRFDWRASLRSFAGKLREATRPSAGTGPSAASPDAPFQTRMAHGLSVFSGRVLLVLSGNDLTAQEFLQYTARSPAWHGLLADRKVSRIDIDGADHTFSSRHWQDQAEEATLAWLRDLGVCADHAAA
jgi:exosortase A-associated hydrolase 1